MKTTKLIAALAAAALTGTTLFAGDLGLMTFTNAKGQQTYLYRTNETSVAVFTGGRGAGRSMETVGLKPTWLPNNKGQAIPLYRAE